MSAVPGSCSSARTAPGGDLVARSYETARKAVEKSGITVHEDFDGEFAAKVETGPC